MTESIVYAPGLKSTGNIHAKHLVSSLAKPLSRIALRREMGYAGLNFISQDERGLGMMKEQVRAALLVRGAGSTLMTSSLGSWAALLALPELEFDLWPRRLVMINPTISVEHLRRRFHWIEPEARRFGVPRPGAGWLGFFWVYPSMVQSMLAAENNVFADDRVERLAGMDVRIVVTEESMFIDIEALEQLQRPLDLYGDWLKLRNGPLSEQELEQLMFN